MPIATGDFVVDGAAGAPPSTNMASMIPAETRRVQSDKWPFHRQWSAFHTNGPNSMLGGCRLRRRQGRCRESNGLR